MLLLVLSGYIGLKDKYGTSCPFRTEYSCSPTVSGKAPPWKPGHHSDINELCDLGGVT